MKPFEQLVAARLQQTVQEHWQIRQWVSQTVPADALTHMLFFRLQGGQLRITVDSAAWVARLRFSTRHMLGALNRQGVDARRVSFHVDPPNQPVDRRYCHREPPRISARAAEQLRSGAASLDTAPACPPSRATRAIPKQSTASATPAPAALPDPVALPEDDPLQQAMRRLADALDKRYRGDN